MVALRKVLLLISGWALLIVGILLTPAPVPIPLIGVVPLLLGCAILSRHSRLFRRGLQYARREFAMLSHFIEKFAAKGPASVKKMAARTHPRILHRHARRRGEGEKV